MKRRANIADTVGGRKRTTLADVAKRAGVSVVTVSHVLNGRHSCWASEKTRQRIKAAAQALGYRPNLTARSLRSGCTNTLGMVTTGSEISSRNNRFAGLYKIASAQGFTVMLSVHANTSELEDLVLRRHIDRGVDGLIVYPSEPGPHLELQNLVQSGFPVVTFDGAVLLDFPCDDVTPDYQAVGRIQAAHLLDLGRRRICIANTIPEARINKIREQAAAAAITAAGAHAPLFMNIEQGEGAIPELERVETGVRAFFHAHAGRFDAVIAFDAIAAIILRLLLEMRIRVPRDVAVIGAGNSMLSEYNLLPLSTITTHDDQLGQDAFDLLRDRMQDKGAVAGAFHRCLQAPTLLARASTIAP